MQKTANFLLLALVFMLFGTQSIVTSSSFSQGIMIERAKANYSKMLIYQEIVHQALIERRMYDSLASKPSVKWLLTGFTETQIKIESNGNQNAISPEGAQGIAQFLPSTWEALKRNKLIPEWFVIGNEAHQRMAQLIYLDYLYNKWYDQPATDRRALMAASYNAGVGTIKDLVKTYGSEWRNYLPDETIKYLNTLKRFV
jgi:soluble lytic murein transglycosylase-like protein